MAGPANGDGRWQRAADGLTPRALALMALLSVQFGIQPVVTRRHASGEIIKSTVVFAQEVAKLLIGAGGIALGRQGWGEVAEGWTLSSWARLALLPAAIYLVQNMCSLVAYQNLDAMTYNVLNQTKTLSAALCCYLLLGKRQSGAQAAALLLLLTAALVMERIVPLDALLPSYWTGGSSTEEEEATSKSSLSPRHFSHGVVPIMAASFLSGLAGAITQRSLQADGGRNALLFTVELCTASLLMLAVSSAASDDGRRMRELGFFHGWTPWTLLPILTNAAGGVLVGMVIKHAGTVRKGFALIFGILLSGIVQSLVDEDKVLSKEEIAGGALAAISLWMHATHPYVKRPSDAAASKPTARRTSGPKRRGRGRKED